MIHEYGCVDVRERIEAFHDGELPINERIAIQQHLADCGPCSMTANDLAELGSTLRDCSAAATDEAPAELQRLAAHVVERIKVEEAFSIRAQVSEWFQDMHLVWAGLGASLATMICVAGSASVLHAANQERPNSMARVIAVLANPGSNDNPLRLNYEMSPPSAVTDNAIELSEEEAEYTLSAVVSREGRVQGVTMINQPADYRPGVNAMLHEAYRMKFAPATARGDAVAVSLVWLVTNTTVKGRQDVDLQTLRQELRQRTTPAPIGPLPIPTDVVPDAKPQPAPLAKPIVPDAAAALAAEGDVVFDF